MTTEICGVCGQKIRKLNPHRMDRQKVTVLELLAKARLEGVEWVKAQEGQYVFIGERVERAPYRVRAHASRLVWFGLAEHGDPRSGEYRATQHGIDFLLGRASVPDVIYCKEGVVIEQGSERVTIEAIKHVVLDKTYWDNYAAMQRYPEDYQDPENDQPSLF